MKVNIFEMVGPNCGSYEDGDKIYNIIYPEVKKGNKVQLDFTKIRVLASPFLNAAIGHLLQDIPIEVLKERLEILNVSVDGLVVINRVIDNSITYYANAKNKKIVDDTFRDKASEDK